MLIISLNIKTNCVLLGYTRTKYTHVDILVKKVFNCEDVVSLELIMSW